MEYMNPTNNAMESVVELLLSLESADLIRDILLDIDTIFITEDNEVQSADKKLIVKCENLQELAGVKYLSAEEFNTLVVSRFCDSIRSCKSFPGKSKQGSLSLRLIDYENVVRCELASLSLSKLFNAENKSDAINTFDHFKKLLLKEDRLADHTIVDVRRDALKRLCETLQDEQETKEERTASKSSSNRLFNTDNNFGTGPDTLHFLQVPHHLVTKAEAKGRIFPSLKPGDKDYDTYVRPLIDNPVLPEQPKILSRAEEQYYFDKFDELPILGNCREFNDYMKLIDNFASSDIKSKDKFRKMFEPRTHNIFNKYTEKDIEQSRLKKNSDKFTNAHGLIAHCYWALNQESSAFNMLRKMETKNNITDYLDTLIRYYIFIEEELLEKVLYNFHIYNDEQHEVKLSELARAKDGMLDPLSDHYSITSHEAKYKRLSKEVKNFQASYNDIMEHGKQIIKIHFNYDILLYIIQTYLFAKNRHEVIIEKYMKK